MIDQLKQYFGFDGFLPGQQEIVSAVCNGKDCCVVMPTGAGKSLCYQLPAVMREGYTLVISPLISLMLDQVEALRARGISAAYLNSTVPASQQQQILHETANGVYRLLYVAPERMRSQWMQNLLRQQPPNHLVVDEAHCISQWGHDFRPDYLRIGQCCTDFNIPQVSAFTATATLQVRDDIRKQLRRDNMETHVTGFERPNLLFSVVECNREAEKLSILTQLLKKEVPTIIYTSTRKAVETLAPEIGGIPYHAGMPARQRSEAQARFMQDPCPVLVATNAFGMGIDRADIRRVIHYNIPGSLEAYYQEAGRAGRDGQPAECMLLSSFRDRFIHEYLIDINNPSEALLKELYTLLRRQAIAQNTHEVEVSPVELAPQLDKAKSDGHVSAALSVLEKLGNIERGYRREATGTLVFSGTREELMRIHQLQKTQRSRLIFRCLDQGGEQAMTGIQCTLDQISQVAGLSPEQSRRVLSALNGDVLTWSPPRSSRTVLFTAIDNETPIGDFQALKEKRDFDMARLGEVINYTRTRSCRQKTIIGYFGQDTGQWTCGRCDNCGGSSPAAREVNAEEEAVIRAVLKTACDLEGRFGRTRIAEILAGDTNERITAKGLDKRPDFGCLGTHSVREILAVVRALERADLLAQTGDPDYPTIDITAPGLDYIDREKIIPVNMPRLTFKAPCKSRKPETISLEGDSLLGDLKRMRNHLAAQRNVPPYRVLTNAALKELAEKRPITPEEAQANIKGVGETKARTIIPRFLEIIKRHGQTD